MTYLQFHFVFILPPLLLLLLTLRGARQQLGARTVWILPVMALIALLYTTAWDNYLVYRGVWWYGADRVIATIGYVPVEEYLFFLLQPLLTGAWTYHVLMRRGVREAQPRLSRTSMLESISSPAAAGVVFYALAAAGGAFALTTTSGLYLGLILAWAAPVLALQWPFIARIVRSDPRSFALSMAVPTLYLWIADRIAIGAGIWTIAPQYTTGLHLFGLPMEEAVFFLVTNLLVVQGVLLFLKPAATSAHERHVPAAVAA
jgi:lycopene beta-cyclase